MSHRLLAKIAICAAAIAWAGSAAASFHLYRINELFSDASGSIQFIEMTVDAFDGQSFWAGQSISVTQGSASHVYTFPSNLPSTATANTSVLIATQGFAKLGIVTPDFIVPAGFLYTDGGTVNFADVDSMSYASLPSDGVLSLNRNGTTGASSPKNFSGITAAVPAPVALNFAAGWNLAGNGSANALDVVTAFGDANKVSTVWKWIASSAKWAFYAPSLTGQALTDYAAGKGYEVLTTINGGEGVWVNARTPFTAPLPLGTAISSASFQSMLSGWNLIAVGDNKSPSQFNVLAASATPLTTLWAWDAAGSAWYFYAPSLDASGGLSTYITSKGYLDFTAANKTLGPGVGFWVNKP